MLNKIQAKWCAPVSSCSWGCLGKLLLADLEKKVDLWGNTLPSAESFLCVSHAPTWFRVSTCPSRVVLCSLPGVSVAGDADDQNVYFSAMILALLMCSTALCVVWLDMNGVGIQPPDTGLSWRTCHRKLKRKSVLGW